MLKVGIFGAGHLGKIHIKLIKEIEDYELVGFFDPDDEVSQKVSEEFALQRFYDIDELIDHCDAIDIVTPTLYHYDIASRAIKKSRHVFIEKPITTTIEEAKNLILLTEEANIKAQVGHVERFNPAFLAAKQFELKPMFIETHRLAQFNPRGTDVSVVLDLMIHDIDIVLNLVKSNPRRISASGVAVVSETPDIANARIEFDNGCVANLTASRISMKNMRKTRLFQKDSYMAIDFLKKKLEVLKMKEGESEDPLAMTLPLPNGRVKTIEYNNPDVDENINAIKLELALFAESIMHNKPTQVPLIDGLNALQVAYQIIERIESGSQE